MRKIETQEEIEKRRKRNMMIMSVLMLGILTISTIGYSFLSSDKADGEESQENSENGIYAYGDRWVVSLNGKQLLLINHPDELKNVSADISMNANSYYNNEVYIDSANEGVYNEITINLEEFAGKVQKACYGNCEEDLPEKNCSSNLIVWKESIENKVSQQENCIFIDGDLKAVDAFLYKIFGGN